MKMLMWAFAGKDHWNGVGAVHCFLDEANIGRPDGACGSDDDDHLKRCFVEVLGLVVECILRMDVCTHWAIMCLEGTTFT